MRNTLWPSSQTLVARREGALAQASIRSGSARAWRTMAARDCASVAAQPPGLFVYTLHPKHILCQVDPRCPHPDGSFLFSDRLQLFHSGNPVPMEKEGRLSY